MKRQLITSIFALAAMSASAAAPTAPNTSPASSAFASASAPLPLSLAMNGTTIAISDVALTKLPPASKTQLKTPWFDTPQDFAGVSFRTFLETYKVPKTATLKIVAHDGYTIEVPASDAWQYDVLLATHQNGNRLTLRDKGPYFLVYPINQPGVNLPLFFARCAWQIKTIEVK